MPVKEQGVAEGETEYGPEWDEMVKRVGQKAQEGPRKTVWDPVKRVYKTVPVNPPKKEDVAEASNKVHLRTPKHGMADHAGRDTGVSKFKFGQTPEKDRCPKCHDLYRKHYKQGVEEASLATMRDYFAGNEDAEDPMKITQMRDFYKKQGDLPYKKKEFRSEWEYQQWLKKNKMINMNKSPVKEELKQNWVQKVMERKK